MKSSKLIINIYYIVLSLVTACAAPPKLLTFKGTTLNPGIKNFSVANFFVDVIEPHPPNLGNTFTETFKTYVQRNSSLKLIQDEADLVFSGSVVAYTIAPAAASGTETQTAQLKKMTITIKVNFVNNFKDSDSFEKSFSVSETFDAQINIVDIEESLIKRILDQIAVDIFNSSVANW